jgi:nucleotide-binding universal stress UspA family protein
VVGVPDAAWERAFPAGVNSSAYGACGVRVAPLQQAVPTGIVIASRLSKEDEMSGLKKILVPTDFSVASKESLRYACTLADALHASLHIIHVTHDPYVAGGMMEFYAPPPDYYAQVERETGEALEALLTEDQKSQYRATLVQRSGAAAYEILDYLREQGDFDLVIMATHGRGGAARLLMGSVTDKIVRAAPCPVLTIRAAGETHLGAKDESSAAAAHIQNAGHAA